MGSGVGDQRRLTDSRKHCSYEASQLKAVHVATLFMFVRNRTVNALVKRG